MTIKSAVRISDLQLSKFASYQELSATVDGQKIWYHLPLDIDIQPRAEAFLAPAMFEAMAKGVNIEIDPQFPISKKLFDSFDELQSIYRNWNDEIPKISLIAETIKDIPANDIILSCFSGGVDSSYTYGKFKDEITHIMLIQGFDGYGKIVGWEENKAARKKFADQQGKKLITVETNVTDFFWKRHISWEVVFGSMLCSLGLAFSPKKYLIPSSTTYSHLTPLGAHPMIDLQWGTETTQIIHHGLGATRTTKTEYIVAHKDLLEQLQTCWRSPAVNCGECPKCIRTSIVLHMMDVQSKNMPHFTDKSRIESLYPERHHALQYLDEIIIFSLDKNVPQLTRKLKRMRRRFLISHNFKELIKSLLGPWSKKLYRKIRPQNWLTDRLTLLPKNSRLE